MIDTFTWELFSASEKCKVDTKESCPTRKQHIYAKGKLNGSFFSIEIIDRHFEKPELFVRDHTDNKAQIIELWENLIEEYYEKEV